MFHCSILKLLLWFLSFLALYLSASARVVQTTSGYVRGTEALSRDAKTFYVWRGIPYAEPPVGKLRFEPPVPIKPWSGIKNTFWYGPRCAQIELFLENFQGAEDCLYLNIHVPEAAFASGKKLPVLFGIHGGYFASGEAREWGPQYFMDEDVILVTPSYRLGLLGFFNTGDEIVRGNMGLKDLRLALKWVHDNIEFFNGDRQRITIQGASSGAAAAHLMLISNTTRDYIHKALIQSGSALCPWALQRNPRNQAIDYAKRIGCNVGNSRKIVACMKAMDAVTLLSKLKGTSVLFAGQNWSFDRIFVPTIEQVITNDTFLPDDPRKLLSLGDFKAVPLLTGSNSGEGLLPLGSYYNDRKFRELFRDRDFRTKFSRQYLSLNLPTEEEQRSKTQDLLTHYLGPEPWDVHSPDTFRIVTTLISDRYFYVDQQDFIRYHMTKAPVYAFYYNKTSPVSIFDFTKGISTNSRLPKTLDLGREIGGMILDRIVLRRPVPFYGVAHGDDAMMYTPFGGRLSFAYRFSRDYAFSKQFVKFMADFVTDTKELTFQGIPVRPLTPKDEFRYLIINDFPGSRIGTAPFKERYLYWRDFLNKTSTSTLASQSLRT